MLCNVNSFKNILIVPVICGYPVLKGITNKCAIVGVFHLQRLVHERGTLAQHSRSERLFLDHAKRSLSRWNARHVNTIEKLVHYLEKGSVIYDLRTMTLQGKLHCTRQRIRTYTLSFSSSLSSKRRALGRERIRCVRNGVLVWIFRLRVSPLKTKWKY